MVSGAYNRLKQVLTRSGILPLKLWVILLVVNLTVLILPLGSIFFFRIYENQLIRETEAELISQSVFIAEIFKREIRRITGDDADNYGIAFTAPQPVDPDSYYTPVKPRLDLATDTIYPSRPDGLPPQVPADNRAVRAGKAINDLLLEAQRTTLAGIRVLDYNGVVVAGRGETGLSLAHVREVRDGLAGKYTSVIRQRISDEPPPPITSISRGTGIRIFTVYPVISEGRLWGAVYLSRTPKSILKHMYAEKNKVILAGLLILALTLFIVLITSWTIARPIYRLIERVRKISAGDRDALEMPDVPGTREMALLTRSFLETARSLEERSSYIRHFATHVSHELKTPLTSIRGAAELLFDHFETMDSDRRQKFLTNIRDDADRLKTLVSRLLELAQADSFTPGSEKCDLVAILQKLAEPAWQMEFDIQVHRAGPVCVRMSAEVLEMILCNMIDNARQHGASRIIFEVRSPDETVELAITDNGEGISPANASKIFDPFFTTRRDRGGTGIGLGIVKSLLENHKGHIRLADTKNGTRFILTLPRPADNS